MRKFIALKLMKPFWDLKISKYVEYLIEAQVSKGA